MMIESMVVITGAEYESLRAENERLRAALDITTEGLEWCVIRAEAMSTPDVGAGSFARICLDKARAALKEPRTDSEAATRALDEYLREGGVTLEELKDELKEPRT